MKKLLLFSFMCAASFCANAQVLHRGSIVPVKIISQIDSKTQETPNVIVNADVKGDDGSVIIAYGTPVQTQVNREKARGCGRPGKISVKFISTTTTNGQQVLLEGGNIKVEGQDKKVLSIGLGAGLGWFVWPALFCLSIKGEQAIIEEGYLTNSVLTLQDVKL